jgi:hypothetical protein
MFLAISVLLKYTAQLLTGGGLMAALWLIDRLTRLKISRRVYLWVVIGILMWAALGACLSNHIIGVDPA